MVIPSPKNDFLDHSEIRSDKKFQQNTIQDFFVKLKKLLHSYNLCVNTNIEIN